MSKITKKDFFRTILKIVRSHFSFAPGLFLSLLGLSIVQATIPFIESKATELVINSFISPDKNQLLFILLFVLAYTLPTFIYSLRGYAESINYILIQEKWDLVLLKKYLEIDIATYEKSDFQTLLSKIRDRGIWPLANIADRIFYGLQNVVEIAIATTITVSFSWQYLVAIFLGAMPKFLVEIIYGQSAYGIWDAEASVRKRFWDLKGYFGSKHGITDLKIYQAGNFVLNWVRELSQGFTLSQKKNERKKSLLQIAAGVMSAVAYGFIALSLIDKVNSGEILVGSLIFALSSIRTFENSFSGLLLNIARQYKDALFAVDVLKVLEVKNVIENNGKIQLSHDRPAEIIFENVSFTYPGHSNPTLKKVNITIKPGEKVAFVGNNGAGKTTLIKILCRIYEPTEGRVLINGIDLREYDLHSWWKHLGILFQDYTTYNFKVKDSIGVGDSERPFAIEEVIEAAVQGEASDFINTWKEKYDQALGVDFDGIEPSKGQRQKIALSRVWYRKAKIFILDEPTASVDAESEMKIFERLENTSRDISAILISHRFSTVKKADQIIVIENGTVEESGTHSDLMNKQGRYAKLYTLQAKGYTENI